ncbi:unnamed protein product [Cuscuta epithymum]|uniref:Uncharacterized protein n=1 Tax=Cuscuta epithymum TaxID=186058 RepID=A0AAV0C0N1_9ASTE|nr:unnamed protein product [Cuscuta epithymum]
MVAGNTKSGVVVL